MPPKFLTQGLNEQEKTNEMWKEIRLKNRQMEENENLKAKLDRTTSNKAALSLRFVNTSKKCSKFEGQLKECKVSAIVVRERSGSLPYSSVLPVFFDKVVALSNIA